MKLTLITLFSLCFLISNAQLPKGDRVLAYQIDMAENNNYDSAFAYAQNGCMESAHLFFPWSSIETSNGNFNEAYMANTLDILDIYYPANGIKAELQIATINTVAIETPSDLIALDFDDPVMINRFKVFLDTLFTHIPNLELTSLNIGNEHDIYMGSDINQYNAYKTFLDSVIPYAKQLYFNLHGTDLKVGTTFTHSGLTSASTSSLCQMVNNGLDIVTLTYYPLNPDFTMKPPATVSGDFTALVNLYPDTQQPIYFAECGYSSSPTCNSSEALQAEFFQNVFSSWDTYYDNIKYLTVFKTTDWSQPEVDVFAIYYGISDIIFLEYLRALGVRTWDNNGTNKLAYETILCELNSRNWCSVSCNSVGISEKDNLEKIKVFPNPSSNYITIDSKEQIKSISVINNLGQTLLKSNINTVNIKQLSNGVYLVKVELENGQIYLEKIIKK